MHFKQSLIGAPLDTGVDSRTIVSFPIQMENFQILKF